MELVPVNDTTKTPEDRFTGDVHLTMVKTPTPPSRLVASLVTEGVGLVVNRDGQVIRMRAGDTVWTPPGEGHWHGGTSGNLMCHLAMLEGTEDGDGTTWLEPVTDEDCTAAHRPPGRQ